MDDKAPKKPFFKTPLGIVLMVLFFPFTLTYLIWAKTKWSTFVKISVIVLMWGVFSAINKADNQYKRNLAAKSTTRNVKTEQKKTEPTAVPQPTKALSTEDKLLDILKQRDGGRFDRNKYTVVLSEDGKDVVLSYSSKDFWDETAIVKGTVRLMVDFGRKAFTVGDIKMITVKYRTEFTDTYGKKSMEDATILTFSKDEFSKFDWDNLKYTPIYNNILRTAEQFYIHPAIRKKVDFDKIYL